MQPCNRLYSIKLIAYSGILNIKIHDKCFKAVIVQNVKNISAGFHLNLIDKDKNEKIFSIYVKPVGIHYNTDRTIKILLRISSEN